MQENSSDFQPEYGFVDTFRSDRRVLTWSNGFYIPDNILVNSIPYKRGLLNVNRFREHARMPRPHPGTRDKATSRDTGQGHIPGHGTRPHHGTRDKATSRDTGQGHIPGHGTRPHPGTRDKATSRDTGQGHIPGHGTRPHPGTRDKATSRDTGQGHIPGHGTRPHPGTTGHGHIPGHGTRPHPGTRDKATSRDTGQGHIPGHGTRPHPGTRDKATSRDTGRFFWNSECHVMSILQTGFLLTGFLLTGCSMLFALSIKEQRSVRPGRGGIQSRAVWKKKLSLTLKRNGRRFMTAPTWSKRVRTGSGFRVECISCERFNQDRSRLPLCWSMRVQPKVSVLKHGFWSFTTPPPPP